MLQTFVMTPEQCRMARAGLGLGVRELAAAADVSTNTIARLERGENSTLELSRQFAPHLSKPASSHRAERRRPRRAAADERSRLAGPSLAVTRHSSAARVNPS